MPDKLHAVIWFLTSGALSLIFVRAGTRNVERTAPAQFWPWMKIREEDLTDVRAYNQENRTMWMSCAFYFLANGIIGLFSRQLALAFYTFFLFPGFWILSRRYDRVLRRYLKRGADRGDPGGCPR